ncbi:hypothetical protein [Kitasatospora sp. NPDC097643]|uniref:hypothetical protein n=1 Tax=Kitasatospora sp. NPDC097643 TaxID=3157230 RepID=UPI003316FB10
MAQLAVLLIVVALAGAAVVVLARRRRALDAEAAAKALARAAELLAAGKAAPARRRYARLAGRLAAGPGELRPQRGLALLGQAEATVATGDREATLALYREAFPLLPDPVRQLPRWSLRSLAEEWIQAPGGDLGPLLAFLQAVAAGAEPGEEAQTAARAVDRLQWLCREGTPAQREDATARALAALPGRDWPVLARAALLRGTDRAEQAERLLAGAAPGGSGELWFRWGAQLFTMHRDEPAVAAFDEALRRGPGEPSPWGRGPALRTDGLLFRGLARQRLGATEAAWADLTAAVSESPADPRPRYALGRLALLLGADEQAREQFDAALTVQPSFAPARFGLALVHERAARPAEAAADYQAGLALAPDWRPARVRLGAALLAAGRTAEADPVLGAEADTEPDSRWARIAAFHHGLALFRSGQPAAALARWQPLQDGELGDRLALARDRLARAALAGNPALARRLWQQAVTDHPAAPGYRSALREAALREAAHLLVTGRDRPESREQALAALALADSLPGAVGHRQARLRAALALAEGSTEPLATLLDPAAGPRDRYHLAAAALLTGRPVQTVALLAPLAPDPGGDPALARLRALLAERAGNWAVALDWYRHFLTADGLPGVPQTAPQDVAPNAPQDASPSALPDGAACAVCARPATAACGGCGREACAAHLHRPEGTAAARCVRCLGPALRAVLDCARRAGLPEQAEPVLADWARALGDSAAAAPVRLDLALLRAELGRLDEALADLPEDARPARIAVLLRRAGAALDAGEPGRAAGELRQVLALAPAHPQAAAALVLLGEHEAHQHAVMGRHREAWQGYRALLLRDPAHPRLLHAVGLAGYRLAAATGPDGNGGAAPGGDAGAEPGEQLWAWTLGCLVAALHQPELWAESARVTGRTPEPQRIAAARKALTDRLRDDLRALDRAAGRSGDEVTAWTVRLGMEAHSAAAFAGEEVRIALPGRPARRLALGPALDGLLRAEPELAVWGERFDRAVQAWRRPGSPDGHPLSQALGLFGELGPQRYLLLQGRQAAAVGALDAIPEQQRGEDWQTLLRETLVGQARQHHRSQEWREALDCLARAGTVPGGALPADVSKIAAESGVRAARALLKGRDDDQEAAAGLLEKALALAPDDPEVRGDLGATYAQWARKINNETKDYPRALGLLRKSLELTPGDPTARHFLQAALGNQASKLSQPDATEDQLLEAAELWQELVDLDPDDRDHRLGYAFVMRQLCRICALDDRPRRAVSAMANALAADPEWTGDTDDEARRRTAVLLANHMLDTMDDRPYAERSAMLDKAATYYDDPDIRRLMVSIRRGRAADLYEGKRYQEAINLLEEALQLSRSAEDNARLRRELGVVYGSYAVHWANVRQFKEARRLVARAVEYAPGDQDLKALQRKIARLY